MMIKPWDELPLDLKTDAVRFYYDILKSKKNSLVAKRTFDVLVSAILLILLAPAFLLIAVIVKIDSQGPVFFRQIRITQYGDAFRIFKFRTMYVNSDQNEDFLTREDDSRITRSGHYLRKYRLDELGQLLNVLCGEMTLVGTRPEVPKYVRFYNQKMMATLLLPAGITSMASVLFVDENSMLCSKEKMNHDYIQKILPLKMTINLKELEQFSFFRDIRILFKTLVTVFIDKNSN